MRHSALPHLVRRTSSRYPLPSLCAALLSACAGSQGATDGPQLDDDNDDEGAATSAIAELPPVSAERTTFYRQAFPTAATFTARRIPSEMIRSVDKGNDTYVVGKDNAGNTVGYLRDFQGPVSLSADCPCNPLDLTLAFLPDLRFATLLSRAPLQKLGHNPLSPAETQRLIDIAKAPAEVLLAAKRPDDVVDATTGATKAELRDAVVAEAAWSTQRIVSLVQDTQRILKGAPLHWDKRRLDEVLGRKEASLDRSKSLLRFVSTADSLDVALYAFRLAADAYGDHLVSGGAPARDVETGLRGSRREPAFVGELLGACNRLAAQKIAETFVAECLAAVQTASAGLDAGFIARLEGLVHLNRGDAARAAPLLQSAAARFDVTYDPLLHLRLAEALRAAGQAEPACAAARALFRAHPLLDGAKALLGSCRADGNVIAVVEEIYAVMRAELLAQKRTGGEPTPPLPLENDAMQQVDLHLAERGKVTVAIFFATWCPHCRSELPHLNAFARAVERDERLKGKVRLVGVRTAIEKETQSYAAFQKEFAPAFPVLTDPVMALGFSKFAKHAGVSAAIPTVAVLDADGVVRYILPSGDYLDIARLLFWAVGDVLGLSPQG